MARFTADHFSWYELLWTVCTSSLQKLGLGAASFYSQLSSRSRYVAVRFQAFMSQPCGKLGNFGLVVTVYKFGDPLSLPSNYPLLVADSGTKRFYLRAGELHVRVEGYFLACQDVEEVLERNGKILDFTGEDFCERFEFALSLKAGVLLPLQEGQVLGKLRFIQWEEGTPIHKSYNLIMPSSNLRVNTRAVLDQATLPRTPPENNIIGGFPFADFTPPRSPEPQYGYIDHTPSPSRSSGSRGTPPKQHPRRKRPRGDSFTLTDHCAPKRQILVRESKLTDKVLLGVSQKCGNKYMELGISLGLDYQTIANRINRLEGKAAEHLKAFEVLQEWKARGSSYEELSRALEDAGMSSVAMEYCYVRDGSP